MRLPFAPRLRLGVASMIPGIRVGRDGSEGVVRRPAMPKREGFEKGSMPAVWLWLLHVRH
ncbi:uncharacterized protein GLRG_10181 [Colletotrichum graminicola M1.001]|uniref:Uncharacterized protein n=1 Tax=Colletotrichum graminicola (strain M1.001 / M2 / FGSC 10212) TaxID=645133 RepID=E3QVZ9_COLGM|nr:uncharacterized protein GLRG_10181 [Colletotrichum graminicola M1.001]EFQ35037.1 hypothetical protein GLRG_10181 [Colletotrichum graminicola M1.001]